MDEREFKLKWSVLGILGIVYTSIGVVMALIGIPLMFVVGPEGRAAMIISLGSMAAFWLIFGGIFLSIELNKRKKVKDAFFNGRKIFAQYDHSEVNRYVKKGFFRPYNVYCKWIDENQQIHFFRSMDVDFNPDSMLQGKMIPVYINPDDLNAYYVDLDCVLPMEHIHTHIM